MEGILEEEGGAHAVGERAAAVAGGAGVRDRIHLERLHQVRGQLHAHLHRPVRNAC